MAYITYTRKNDEGSHLRVFSTDTSEEFIGLEDDGEFSPVNEILYYSLEDDSWILNRVRMESCDCAYEEISEADARQWLLDNDYPKDADRRFNRTQAGLPPKGEKVEFEIPFKVLDQVDALAAGTGFDRQEMIRRLLEAAIDVQQSLVELLILEHSNRGTRLRSPKKSTA